MQSGSLLDFPAAAVTLFLARYRRNVKNRRKTRAARAGPPGIIAHRVSPGPAFLHLTIAQFMALAGHTLTLLGACLHLPPFGHFYPYLRKQISPSPSSMHTCYGLLQGKLSAI